MKNKYIILILSFFSSILMLSYFYDVTKKINFSDLALDNFTKTVVEEYDGIKINFLDYDIDKKSLLRLINYDDIVISFGNSQSHSINDYDKKSDHLFVYYMNEKKLNQKKIIINLSASNGNLQEMFLSLVNAEKELSDKLKVAIFSLVFDDMREDGVRQQSYYLIKNNTKELNNYLTGQVMLTQAKEVITPTKDQSVHTLKEITENKINHVLSDTFKVYENRGNIRSFFYGELYFFRNWILNIKPTTKRKRIDRVYKANIQALKDIIEFCNKNKIKPILYIAPIRQDIEMPYIKNEYISFKHDINDVQKAYDLDNIVSGEYWGIANGEWIDFMHFKDEGHRILAKELVKIIDIEKGVK